MSGITVIGSLNMDISIKAPRLPVPGESVIGSEVLKGWEEQFLM